MKRFYRPSSVPRQGILERYTLAGHLPEDEPQTLLIKSYRYRWNVLCTLASDRFKLTPLSAQKSMLDRSKQSTQHIQEPTPRQPNGDLS